MKNLIKLFSYLLIAGILMLLFTKISDTFLSGAIYGMVTITVVRLLLEVK